MQERSFSIEVSRQGRHTRLIYTQQTQARHQGSLVFANRARFFTCRKAERHVSLLEQALYVDRCMSQPLGLWWGRQVLSGSTHWIAIRRQSKVAHAEPCSLSHSSRGVFSYLLRSLGCLGQTGVESCDFRYKPSATAGLC